MRGLDYYTHTAFEFVTDALGAQGAVIAGGRYDRADRPAWRPRDPGIGWAGGIERLAMLSGRDRRSSSPHCADPGSVRTRRPKPWKIGQALRRDGFIVDQAFRGNLGKRMKRADKLNAAAALIFGDDELAKGVVQVRNLTTGDRARLRWTV